ncbi:unnamed protein product, partial [Didymodactylos carnosus]
DDGEWKEMINNEKNRMTFIDSLLNLSVQETLDGLDFDWEYPCYEYKSYYTQFISELKANIKKNPDIRPSFLLTTAVGAGKGTIDDCYEITALGRLLDFIHLMTYDYH